MTSQVKIGEALGVRLWRVRGGGVLPLTSDSRWPMEIQQARHHCMEPDSWIYRDLCKLQNKPAPTMSDLHCLKYGDNKDGYGMLSLNSSINIRVDRISRNIVLSTVEGKSAYIEGDLIGLVEAWGNTIEGPNGVRSEYMRPLFLYYNISTLEKHRDFASLSDKIESILRFANAWNALVTDKLDDFLEVLNQNLLSEK